jgi:SOS response regulatory protein OraA/RecX
MAYFSDSKPVSNSFREALKDVLGPKKADDEVLESSHESEAEEKAEEKAEKKSKKKEVEETVEAQDDLTELTEEELFLVMEQELGPHIAYLLDEGFSEEEIENIIVEMLSEEEAD